MTLTTIKPAGLSKPVDLADNERIRLGTGNDLQIYHDGNNSRIADTGTGGLVLMASAYEILNAASNETLISGVENGAVNLFFDNSKKFETTSIGCGVTGNLTFADNGKAIFGAGDDLQIYHSGTQSYVTDQGTGNLNLQGTSKVVIGNAAHNENMAQFFADGAVELYHNNIKMIETTSTGTSIPDGKFAKFGASDDMAIGHNTYNYITYSGADFLITGDNTNHVKIMPRSDESAAVFKPNAEVELYYDNSKKFQTTNSGIRITSSLGIANVGGTFAGSGGTENWMGIKDSAGNFQFAVKTAGTNNGCVGIGTTSPACGLHIDNPNNAAIAQILDTDNSAVKLVFRNNTETGNNMQIGADGSNLVALTNATERMRIASNGLVSVKTNGINLENSTATNSRAYSITNAAGTTGWTFGNGVISSAHQFVIYDNTAGAGRMLIDSNGIARFNNGIQLGNGLTNSTANQLDDYEEGTWSPTMNATGALTVHSAHYIKVGSKVTYQAYMTFPSMSGTNSLRVQNFPFDVALGNDYHSCAVNSSVNLGEGSGKYQIVGQFNNGAFLVFAKPSNNKATISEMSSSFVLFSLTIVTH